MRSKFLANHYQQCIIIINENIDNFKYLQYSENLRVLSRHFCNWNTHYLQMNLRLQPSEHFYEDSTSFIYSYLIECDSFQRVSSSWYDKA